jgi:hypothetical protein
MSEEIDILDGEKKIGRATFVKTAQSKLCYR